ncbi:restriction endonuclease subunit S [Spongiibacter sp. IMCC21906]|uniref:restriction endonuclease subunit S n=1 Tax=Spongiibacter sp. IMCC21906 TaxID=1620392 RepID=UPI00062E3D98|nr:restriction endonuclease subunit S [Spongiibacter sp. IMCC21906]
MTSIVELPKYEAYKDSGYGWIGNVPSKWEVSKLGSCLSPISIKNHPDLPLLSITREKGVIERDIEDQDSNHNFIPDDLSGYKLLKEGQFGMNKMKAWQGSYGVSNHTGIVSPAYFVFDFVKPICPSFFNWAIRSNLYVSYFGSASDGVRVGQWDLSKSRMKFIPFLIPSEQDQKLIANFLDKKTTQIDEAIAIKEQQIALLKERKQIIIQKAVTQGLGSTNSSGTNLNSGSAAGPQGEGMDSSSNVPMKDSGVDWIGEMPTHWDLVKLRGLGNIVRGGSPRPAGHPMYFSDEGVHWITVGEVTKNENAFLEKTTGFLTKRGVEQSRYIESGTFLLTNSGATLGVPKISRISGCINDGVLAFLGVNESRISKNFLYYFFSSQTMRIRDEMNQGATQPNLNTNLVKNMKLPLPPVIEQEKIVEWLNKFTIDVRVCITIQNEQIKKLKEYKTTLINSAVTGKIKVTPEMAEMQEAVEA